MLIISGRSCSGKDTISKELIKLGYKKLTTYTTRPIRPNEEDGVDYNFIKTEEFLRNYIDDFFLEVRYYNTVEGIWFYGSSVQNYLDADKKTFCILTPSGVKKLKEKNIPHTAILIESSDYEIKKRLKNRGDNPEEAERRFNADKIDFADCDDLFDVTFINEHDAPYDVATWIDKYLKELNA